MQVRISSILAVMYFFVQLLIDGILPKLGLSTHELYKSIGIMPVEFWSGKHMLAPVSWIFLHDNWPGLFFMIFILLTLGRSIEREMGSLKLILIMLIPGFIASLPILYFMKDSYIIVTGSQVSLWSICSVCMVFYWKTRLRFLFVNMTLGPFCAIFLGVHFISFIVPLLDGGAWLVMPGGMLFGILYAWIGLGLQTGMLMKQEIKIFSINLFVKNKIPAANSYLAQLQNQSKSANINLPAKQSNNKYDYNAESFNKENIQKEYAQSGIESNKEDFQSNEDTNKTLAPQKDTGISKPKNPEAEILSKQNSDGNSDRKLLLDPITGEFYFQD